MDSKAIDPHKNGIGSLVVHLYTLSSSNPKKEFWTVEEICDEMYPNVSSTEKANTVSALRTNLAWIKSKKALETRGKNSIKPIGFRLSSLIDELYNTAWSNLLLYPPPSPSCNKRRFIGFMDSAHQEW